jgi:hypothetical protein
MPKRSNVLGRDKKEGADRVLIDTLESAAVSVAAVSGPQGGRGASAELLWHAKESAAFVVNGLRGHSFVESAPVVCLSIRGVETKKPAP